MFTDRAAWGGPTNPFGRLMSGPATSVTVHHSWAPNVPKGATAKAEHKAMMQVQKNHAAKWLGIGYNFAITQNGNIYEGRGWGRVGAHAGSKGNAISIGVCFLIDGRTVTPSPEALTALAELRKSGVEGVHLTRDHALKFHRDWMATECPGAAVVAALTRAQPPAPRVLRRGMSGPDVRMLQWRLEAKGYLTAAQIVTGPGIFGDATTAAVRAAQRDAGLEVDGVVGSDTRRALGLT